MEGYSSSPRRNFISRSINKVEKICKEQRWNKEQVARDLENTTSIFFFNSIIRSRKVSCAEYKKSRQRRLESFAITEFPSLSLSLYLFLSTSHDYSFGFTLSFSLTFFSNKVAYDALFNFCLSSWAFPPIKLPIPHCWIPWNHDDLSTLTKGWLAIFNLRETSGNQAWCRAFWLYTRCACEIAFFRGTNIFRSPKTSSIEAFHVEVGATYAKGSIIGYRVWEFFIKSVFLPNGSAMYAFKICLYLLLCSVIAIKV